MSGFRAWASSSILPKARSKVRVAPWYGVCILLSSCLYMEPAWTPEQNLAPSILFPPPSDTENTFLLDQLSLVQVQVSEPDGDRVRFQWTAPEIAQAEIRDFEAEPGVWISSLTVTNKVPQLNSALIRVDTVDGAKPNPNRLDVEWRVVLEAP